MKPQGDTSVTDTRRTKFKVTRKTVADQGEPPPCPHIFRPKWGPKGPKYFFWDRAPPPYLRVWMTAPPPLSEGLDPALTLSLNFLHLIFFLKMLGVADSEISHELSSGRKALVYTLGLS